MTAELLDIGILALIAISLIIGAIRGVVREFISLATWLVAIGFAALYVQPLAKQVPFFVDNEVARMGVAFIVIFFGVLIVGAIVSFLLNAAISSIGLKGIDHFFGALFGFARGALIVVLLVILVGVTSIPANSWWVESRLVPYFEDAAAWVKSRIPTDFAAYFNQSSLAE